MAAGRGLPIGAVTYDRTGQPPSRAWPFFDPRREQADDLSNAGRAHICRRAGGGWRIATLIASGRARTRQP
jgi:hypothetical protein